MDNHGGLSEVLREVVHEDALKIGGTTKAPDYSFRTGGARKFFLETKKPVVALNVKEEPAYQLRRYAWTAKLPVSILTNFEEFAVYDGRVLPEQKDSPKKARLDYFKFTEYADRWDEMTARFSKDAVLSGAFDRYAADARDKRLSLPVDAAFLAEISGWREKLARSIIGNNPALAPRELNYAVQMIIDGSSSCGSARIGASRRSTGWSRFATGRVSIRACWNSFGTRMPATIPACSISRRKKGANSLMMSRHI